MTEKIEIDLREIGRGLVKRAWLIVLCAVLLGAAFLLYTYVAVTPMYKASVTMYVNNNYEAQSDALSSGDLAVALRLVNSYVELVQRDVVLEEVARAVPSYGLSADSLRGMVSANVVKDTEIFTITVVSSDPYMARDVANTIAHIAPNVISAIIPGSRATLIDDAPLPRSPYSPNYATNTLLGVVAGALLATIAILVYMQFDVHVKNEAILESICKAPVLGVIPDFAETIKIPSKKARK